jgi:hypothetical protein
MRLQLACTSIRHFKLNHRITKGFEISLLESRVWPLRTLHLELTCDLWKKETIAVLYASILRLCAPSLETLVWIPVVAKATKLSETDLYLNFLACAIYIFKC